MFSTSIVKINIPFTFIWLNFEFYLNLIRYAAYIITKRYVDNVLY